MPLLRPADDLILRFLREIEEDEAVFEGIDPALPLEALEVTEADRVAWFRQSAADINDLLRGPSKLGPDDPTLDP